MPVLSDIPIKIHAQDVLLALNNGRKPQTRLLDQTQRAIETARTLWQPMAVYEWLPAVGLEGESLLLDDGKGRVPIAIGPHADLLAPAEVAMVSAVTIGAPLDAEIEALNQNGRLLEGYLLDSVGVVALSEVGKAVRRLAEKEAGTRGWGVSELLGPGSLVGWPLTGQADLCALIDLAEIQLTLNDSGVLIPFKSASSLIGMGPAYTARKVGSVCRFCMHADTCWRKREN